MDFFSKNPHHGQFSFFEITLFFDSPCRYYRIVDIIDITISTLRQVWAGNEACEPVTWQECKLVPKTVKFIVPEINCTDGQEVRSCMAVNG